VSNLCEVKIRQPFNELSEKERYELVMYLSQLPYFVRKYGKDVHTFTMDHFTVEGV
jgi:hypothetical protein